MPGRSSHALDKHNQSYWNSSMVNTDLIANIFVSMSIGSAKEDTMMAIEWLERYVPHPNTISDQYVRATDAKTGAILAWLPKPKFRAECHTPCWRNVSQKYHVIKAITRELKASHELFVQLKICLQGVSRPDAERDLRMLVDFLDYFAASEICHDFSLPSSNASLGTSRLFGYYLTKQVLLASEGNAFLACLHRILRPMCTDFRVLFVEEQEKDGGFYPRRSSAIVLSDADLDSACSELLNAAFDHHGNMPWSVRTVLVQEDVLPTFISRMKRTIAAAIVGDADDAQVDFTYPHLAGGFLDHYADLLTQAARKGIDVHSANDRHSVFKPTLFIGGKMNVLSQVPFLNVLGFRTAKEAIALTHHEANLFGVSVWTFNVALANELSCNLKAHAIWVNCHSIIHPEMDPFIPEQPYTEQHSWGKLNINDRVARLKAAGEAVAKLETNATIKQQWVELLIACVQFAAEGSKVMFYEGHEIKRFAHPCFPSNPHCKDDEEWRKEIVVSLVLGYPITKFKSMKTEDEQIIGEVAKCLELEVCNRISLSKHRIYKYVCTPTSDSFC